jgi:hypothetical protein
MSANGRNSIYYIYLRKHRLVYSIDQEIITIYIISAKGHYDDK